MLPREARHPGRIPKLELTDDLTIVSSSVPTNDKGEHVTIGRLAQQAAYH
jgi:hypothetical protein